MSDGTIQVKRLTNYLVLDDSDSIFEFNALAEMSRMRVPRQSPTIDVDRLEFYLWEVQEEIDKLESRKDTLLARIAYANMRGGRE